MQPGKKGDNLHDIGPNSAQHFGPFPKGSSHISLPQSRTKIKILWFVALLEVGCGCTLLWQKEKCHTC